MLKSKKDVWCHKCRILWCYPESDFAGKLCVGVVAQVPENTRDEEGLLIPKDDVVRLCMYRKDQTIYKKLSMTIGEAQTIGLALIRAQTMLFYGT